MASEFEIKKKDEQQGIDFEVPSWAGKPPPGFHLDVMKGEKLIQNLTEYNTALNRRIGNMAIPEDDFGKFRKRKNISVSFDDEEQIINPEDIDPSIGRFRNLVHTALIPKKKQRLEVTGFSDASEEHYSGSENAGKSGSHVSAVHSFQTGSHLSGFGPISAKLGLSLPNSAPDIELYGPTVAPVSLTGSARVDQHPPVEDEPRKKKYAKEAWPGKKTGAHLLV